MNSATNEVNKAHRAYLLCVDAQMKEYLSGAPQGVAEFCPAEKSVYHETIKKNFPGQFSNMVRIDANTY